MAGKDNWRRFLDAIYSKWRLFLPILLLFFPPLPQLLPSPAPLPPLISWHAVTYLPFLPPFFLLSFYLPSKCEIWINVCVSEGTASCELQIFGQRSNLFEMTNQAEQFVDEEQFLWSFSLWKSLFFFVRPSLENLMGLNATEQVWQSDWTLIWVINKILSFPCKRSPPFFLL